jgi:HTH-type transcriptional regulator, competence development regulator
MQHNQNLGNYLRVLRKERDLTLHQVAIGVDVDSPLLSKLERSERLPTTEQVKRLATFFDLNENELLAKVAAVRIIKEYGLGEVTQQAVKMVQEQLGLTQIFQKCQKIIIENDKFDEDVAYGELIKVVFMKIYVEQALNHGNKSIFDRQWLEESNKFFSNINTMFKEARAYFGELYFEVDERLKLSENALNLVLDELKDVDFRKRIDKVEFKNQLIYQFF